jgi:hypothetical protein
LEGNAENHDEPLIEIINGLLIHPNATFQTPSDLRRGDDPLDLREEDLPD